MDNGRVLDRVYKNLRATCYGTINFFTKDLKGAMVAIDKEIETLKTMRPKRRQLESMTAIVGLAREAQAHLMKNASEPFELTKINKSDCQLVSDFTTDSVTVKIYYTGKFFGFDVVKRDGNVSILANEIGDGNIIGRFNTLKETTMGVKLFLMGRILLTSEALT